MVPISILIGAIIISLSICWGSGKLWSGSEIKKSQPGESGGSITERKDAPSLGSGKLEITIFSDFQCPFCQQFWSGALKEIKSKYVDTGKVKLVFRHFPIPSHVNAQKSAEAAECANRQGKFWEYHDVLFSKMKPDGTNLDIESLKSYASNLGLDTQKFNACLNNGEAKEIASGDFLIGQKAGVTGTPTIFVGEKKIVGAQPFSVFEAAIKEAL